MSRKTEPGASLVRQSTSSCIAWGFAIRQSNFQSQWHAPWKRGRITSVMWHSVPLICLSRGGKDIFIIIYLRCDDSPTDPGSIGFRECFQGLREHVLLTLVISQLKLYFQVVRRPIIVFFGQVYLDIQMIPIELTQ